ncbi:LamG domain-containing protein [Hyalangium versicolor]|uniref:LamG domain-containing protein n=1 Tax=Hyalangium versicolor TaxID=2861190 RepID=UPI001CC934F7|nr:LamG domain-containing protein [Hyalangium versicolor]
MAQTQLPASFAGVLSMSAGEMMNLGPPTPALDGSSSFTITGWFQVPPASDTFTLVNQGNNFSLFFTGTSPGVALGNYRLTSSLSLSGYRFVQLGAVYTPPGASGAGKLQLFVNGDPADSVDVPVAPSGGNPSANLIVGNSQHPVAVRRLWLTSTALSDTEMIYTRFGTTGTALTPVQSTWDWGQIPAVILGAPTPVPSNSSVSPSVTTPGLVMNGTGSASANLPQGTSFTTGSLQGWFWFPTSSRGQEGKSQTLCCVGSSGSQIALSVAPTSNSQWTLQVTLGSTNISTTSTLSGWHNLAVTWNSGTSGNLYLDGQHSSHHGTGTTSSVHASSVFIGNTSGGGHAFTGVIQSVALWNTLLTAQDINVQMKPWFPITNVNPVGFYDFTQEHPIDVVSGATLTLQGNASVNDKLWAASSVAPSLQMLMVTPKPEQPLHGLRPQHPPKPNPALWTPQKEEALLKDLQDQLAKGATDPRVQAQGAALVAKLKEQFARGRAGNPDLTGLVRTERQGEEWITFYYDKEGPRAILRQSTAEVVSDPCTNWMIDFVATGLFGLLDIMGIPVSMGVGVKAIRKLLGKQAIWEAVTQVVEANISTNSILGLVGAINNGGGMTAFVDAVLDSISWWDFAWMVLEVTLELLALFVPAAWAIVGVKCALLVVRLAMLESERPAGCP